MSRIVRYLAGGAGVAALAWSAFAQDSLAQAPAIEQRVAMLEDAVGRLEAAIATLDTRLALAIARPGDDDGQGDVALAARMTELERTVERLATDLQRAERVADNAARAASQAQRHAMTAQQAARDAAMRAR